MVKGKQVHPKIELGSKELQPATVYFDKEGRFEPFYMDQKIWGFSEITYFLNHIVIIDNKNKRFGMR